jgi:hypothetical protein
MKTANIAPAYAGLYAGLCEVARENGYALAIHGSLANDMDLVAVPWVNEAVAPEVLAEAMWKRVKWLNHQTEFPYKPQTMPHGRLAWFFPLLQAPPNEGRSGIDLSITPRT